MNILAYVIIHVVYMYLYIIINLIFRIRLREGFKFAHSSAGIINMVLQVDMIEVSI